MECEFNEPFQTSSQFLDTLYPKMFFPLILRLKRVTAHKASLIDNIFANDPLSHSINCIITPLTSIFNLSITTGAVPDEMKITRLIPLYKSGAHNVFTNYRAV